MTNFDEAMGKPGYVFRLQVTEDSLNAGANTSRAVGRLYIIKGPGTGRFTGYSVSWAVNLDDGNTASGSLPGGYDFSSYSELTLWSGNFTVTHSADGSKTLSVSASFTETDPSPELGNASVSGSFPLSTLRMPPNAPTGVTSSWVSDTSVGLAWTNNYPSNGAPSTNNIQHSVNGGAFQAGPSIAVAGSVNVSSAVNRKTIFQVNAENATGVSAWSASSNPVFTTPAAPSGVSATKVGSDIVLGWVNNVGFSEYETVIEHGTVTAGVTTWDGSELTQAASGAVTFTDVAPNPSNVHVYRFAARNLDTGALVSAWVVSNTVQLLAPPNAPTFGTVPAYANKAANLVIPWAHNPVDTTSQTAYELEYSVNGGSSTSTGKVTSATSSYTIAGSTYSADDVVTVRVRTWGDATTGGSDTTGASVWSTTKTVTFKSRPVATITSPADSSTYVKAALTVVLGFAQAESATFVQATISLYQGATLLEQVVSTTLGGTLFATRVADGGSYTVKATETDSNGLVTAQVTSDFTVAYTVPVTPGVDIQYLREFGIAQIGVTVPTAGSGEADAVSVSISRAITGVSEPIVTAYPSAASLTILDFLPTINGTNTYTVTTISADGATTDVDTDLVCTEGYWGFLNTGTDFSDVVSFMGDLKFAAAPSRSSALVPTAGRVRPIALFGAAGGLVVTGSVTLTEDLGATPQEMRAFVLRAGRTFVRLPDGTRVAGQLTGGVDSPSSVMSSFSFSVAEAE